MHTLLGAVKHYDWGSPVEIPNLLGMPVTGQPVAEYWLGTHPSGPASYADTTLADAVAKNPDLLGETAKLEFDNRLPYMVKLLSAARPLSLQAHPNRFEAKQGYQRENELSLAVEAHERTFKDPWDKPELLVALTEFDALVGFRDPKETLELFERLGVSDELEPLLSPLRHRDAPAGLAQVLLDCLILDEARAGLVTEVVAAAINHVNAADPLGEFARTAVLLDEHFPGDPSLLGALLMNRVHLHPGDGLHIRTGQMHAYLHGTGVEVMGSSDNVLRGGLTSKHIDPTALVQVVDFEPTHPPLLDPVCEGPGLWHYDAQEEAFALWRLELQPGRVIPAPAEPSGRILLVTDGEIGLSTGMDGLELSRGGACFIPAGEAVQISGHGQAFLTATGMDAQC